MSDSELTEQPIRQDTRCPSCGGEPEATVEHRLYALGYLHDDQGYTCSECGNGWTCGVPIGDFDRNEMAVDLQCESCGEMMLPHWIRTGRNSPRNQIRLDLKCSNTECHYLAKITRDVDDDGDVLVGYQETAGQTEGADPYGYPD